MLSLIFFANQLPAIIEPSTVEGPYNYSGELVNMALSLVCVTAVIALSVFVMKKILKTKWRFQKNGQAITILERKALSPKSAIYLVDVLGKGLVIAEGPQGVTTLKELPEGMDTFSALNAHANAEPENEPEPSFVEVFKKLRPLKRD